MLVFCQGICHFLVQKETDIRTRILSYETCVFSSFTPPIFFIFHQNIWQRSKRIIKRNDYHTHATAS